MGIMKVAAFASGGGSNLQAIINGCQDGSVQAEVVAVIGNNSRAGARERAEKYGIQYHHVSSLTHPDQAAYEARLLEILDGCGAELIVLAGYMKKIPGTVVEKYTERIINIHPALLPSFGGQGMYGRYVHEAVLDRGCKVSGVTVHLVDGRYDNGPIVAQRAVPVEEGDTPETLAARVLAEEHRIYPYAVQLFAAGKIKVIDRIVRIV